MQKHPGISVNENLCTLQSIHTIAVTLNFPQLFSISINCMIPKRKINLLPKTDHGERGKGQKGTMQIRTHG